MNSVLQHHQLQTCLGLLTGFILMMLHSVNASAQEKYEREPIRYSESKPQDKVQQLADAIAGGSETLEWDNRHGYLKSVLQKLDVPTDSQSLVFSKTSLQVGHISPQTPRAIYFNDEIYVGWVQNGDVIEISAADPKLGATFYSLQQLAPENENFERALLLKRETSRCLQCHDSSRTGGRPGHMVRSVYPIESGQPAYELGTKLSTDQLPFRERFGGWFVSGTHGEMRHLGNAWIEETGRTSSTRRGQRDASELDRESGANVKDLSELLNVKPYVTPHSDIVAQLVLQHQVTMHNVIAQANYDGRQAVYDAKTMNKIFERPEEFVSESTKRRIHRAAERVVQGLLFCGEAKLAGPVEGSNEFRKTFEQRGPFAAGDRSLRNLDLQSRLLKYPCSFLIYSDAFKSLPRPVLQQVYLRLSEVLNESDMSDDFSHLDSKMRAEIKEVLEQTGIKLPPI